MCEDLFVCLERKKKGKLTQRARREYTLYNTRNSGSDTDKPKGAYSNGIISPLMPREQGTGERAQRLEHGAQPNEARPSTTSIERILRRGQLVRDK